MTNEAMPGLVKVGFTSKLPEDRTAKLYTTGVPLPFDVEYRCLTMQPEAVEHLAHEFLAGHRVTVRREYFRAEPEAAVEAVEQANRNLNGVVGCTEGNVTRIRRGDRIAVPAEPGEILLLLRHSNPFLSSSSSPDILDVFQVHDPRSQLELYGIGGAEQIPGLSDPGEGLLRDPVPYLDRDQRVFNGTMVAIERLIPGDQLLWISSEEPASSRVFEINDWCQLVGRTWDPRLLQNTFPPVWNCLVSDLSPRVLQHAQKCISMLPVPRSWTDGRTAASSDVRQKVLSREEWLGQLR